MKKDWYSILQDEMNKPYFKDLMSFIDQEYKNKTVYPVREEIFRAFELTPFSKVKVVILGQDPYHDENQAHGLAFSVPRSQPIPPSLRNIYKELNTDLGIIPPEHGNLTHWAEEGIMLLNTILTVRAHEPLSHKDKGWEQFTDNVIQILNQDDRPKVFVFWGNNAQTKINLITNENHLVIKSSHPSPLSARHSFFGSQIFSNINAFLLKTNQKEIDFTIPSS